MPLTSCIRDASRGGEVTRDINGAAAQTSDAMENYYSSVRKGVEENKNDQRTNRKVLTDIPHGFYGDNPAGIWQPVKLVISNPLKVEDVFIKPALDGASMDITVKNHSARRKTSASEWTSWISRRERPCMEHLY